MRVVLFADSSHFPPRAPVQVFFSPRFTREQTAVGIDGVDIGTKVQQRLDNGFAAGDSSAVQRRLQGGVPRIDRGLGLEQQHGDVELCGLRCQGELCYPSCKARG
jgi:hypothetical protein